MMDFLKELTRRKVWLFGGAYLGLGWVVFQLAIAIESTLGLPNWIDQLVLVLLTLGFPFALLLAWAQESQKKESHAKPGQEEVPASVEGAKAQVPLHSFAALPLDNLSDDPRLGFVGAGIAEDILTHITADRYLKVASRNSSFQYKEGTRDMPAIGKALGVRFILEGSLRLVGDQVRANGQLIDVKTGDHAWANRDDYRLEEFLADHDHIVMNWTASIAGVIRSVGSNELTLDNPEALPPQDLLNLTAGPTIGFLKEKLLPAKKALEWQLEREPENATAHAFYADVLAKQNRMDGAPPEEARAAVSDHIEQAVTKSPGDALVLTHAGNALVELGLIDEGLVYARRAMRLAPASFTGWTIQDKALVGLGDFEAALASVKEEEDLISETNVFFTFLDMYRAWAMIGLGNYAEGEEAARRSMSHRPDFRNLSALLVALAAQDKIGAAKDIADRLRAVMPFPNVDILRRDFVRTNRNEDFVRLVFDCFDKVGLVEEGR